MKRSLVCLALFLSSFVKAQIIDTAGLRSYINSRIVTNGNRSITALNLNDILNAYLNLWPNDSIALSKGGQYDTLYYYKRGKAAFYTLLAGTNTWTTTGNSGLNASQNFIGTIDDVPLLFKANNQNAAFVSSHGDITAFGYQAGNPTQVTSGFNTAFGYQSLQFNNSSGNSGFGFQTLRNNTDGFQNTAVGYNALLFNTTGFNNVALGMQTLVNNLTGGGNTAIGSFSQVYNEAGSNNTGVGQAALQYTDGNLNTAVGYGAAQYQFGSDSNLSVGAVSGGTLNSGKSNTFIGTNTGRGIVGGSYNTILGANVTGLSASLSNNIIIADGQGNRRVNIDKSGNVMFNTTTPSAKNTFSGSGVFTDTLTATTMGITDSSNRVATTAWVKRKLPPTVYSGTYTPVVTVESGNIDINQVLECTVMRIGNIVHVAGKIVVTVNDGNQAAFALSLPFPSSFTSEDDCSGTIGTLSTPGYNGGAIDGEEGTNLAVVIFQPGAVSSTAVIFQFTYIIK